MTRRVAVLGSSGFVGSHVAVALNRRGADVTAVRTPRLGHDSTEAAAAYLSERLSGCDSVVNAAGIAAATSSERGLDLANHQLPRLLAQIARAHNKRLVHVSSAAVQGRRTVLDATPEYAAFSPYSASKAAGERSILSNQGNVCAYRPPGVHGPDRSVTRSLVRLARTRLASVSAPGTQNTPQALIENVADAIAFLAIYEGELPPIVHHPSEGLSVESLLHSLGGRPPHRVPRLVAQAGVCALFVAARGLSGLEGHARRLEVLWRGQEQAPSWLTSAGWEPVSRRERWSALGAEIWRELETQHMWRQERR